MKILNYMRVLTLTILFSIFLIITSFQPVQRKFFSLEIFYQPMIYPPLAKYSLTQNRIKIETSNDFRFRSFSTVYQKQISERQSDNIYSFLNSLNLDTLKKNYSNLIMYDATYITFKIKGEGIKTKQTTTYGCSTALTDSLTKMLEKQILITKYRWDSLRQQ